VTNEGFLGPEALGARHRDPTAAAVLAITGVYVLVGAATLFAVLTSVNDRVFARNTPVWILCALVLASGVVTFTLSIRMYQGADRVSLAVGIVALVAAVGIAVVLGLPVRMPPWMRFEQILALVLMLLTALTSFVGRVRSSR
jgi:cytochrome bd-type quinol oxidase subunit 2